MFFFKILTEGAISTEAGGLIAVFQNSHRKGCPSPPAVALNLDYLVGVPSKAGTSGREKKQVRINIQKTREYLDCGDQISPKSSPLQGMKAKPRQSLFVGKVTNANYQPFS